jgi:hypothetical protein
VVELAARRLGVVTRRELLRAGLTDAAIGRRVSSGLLQRLHSGVYAVGHRALRPEAYWIAAVLACGTGAVLSHRSAAMAWGLRSAPGPIDITASGGHGRRRRGIADHHGRLTPVDVTARHGIPITTVPRTLLDLAETVPRKELMRALDAAVRARLYSRAALEAIIARSPGRRGLKPLNAALTALHPGKALTRSAFERLALPLLATQGIPRGEINARAAGYEVDLLWRDHRLAVELDGRAFHASPASFRDDRRRDADLQAAGYRVLRFTYQQVTEETGWVVTRIRQLLA